MRHPRSLSAVPSFSRPSAMKYLLLALVVAGLCWLGYSRSVRSATPAVATAARSESVPPPMPAVAKAPTPPPIVTRVEAPPPPPARAALPQTVAESPAAATAVLAATVEGAKPWPKVETPFIEPTRPTAPPTLRAQIQLEDVLKENNLYDDAAFGISATVPEGLRVVGARRWGLNNSENTVSLQTETPSSARPSMYYQEYPSGFPEAEGPRAYLERVAQNKENQRIAGGMADYKNVPSSFEFTDINGNPALTYFGVFTRGNEVQTELFVRVLGKKGYVMFFVPGRMEDVQAIMPKIREMAASVKVP